MAPRISDALKEDHRELESYYKRLVESKDPDEQTRYQNLFTWELARHSIGEELVVYPALEKHVPNGVSMADRDRQEHQSVSHELSLIARRSRLTSSQKQVKEQLKAFQNMKPTNPEFMSTIKALMDDLSKHIKEEEVDDLPKLEERLSEAESEKLSKSFGRTKMFVPSRSHPSAPDKPPFETVVGLLAAPIDHLADLFRKWPDTSGMPNPSTK